MDDMHIRLKAVETPGRSAHKSNMKNDQGGDFKNILKNAVNNVSNMQSEADKAIINLHKEKGSLHETLIAMEKASLSFQTVIQVRNKVVDAYQEIMRMQI
jgi:flagellar hook-basal body complex protein FliE